MYRFIFLALPFLVLLGCTSKTEHAKLTFLLKGNKALEKGNLEKAHFFYNEAIKTDSTFIDAYLNNALVLQQQGKLYDAVTMYDAVLELVPQDMPTLYKRANLYLELDQYYRALDDAKALLPDWVDSANVYFVQGLAYTRLHNYAKALQAFKTSLTKDPSLAEAYVNMGNVFYYAHQPDSAKIYLNKGLTINKNQPNAYNTLGLLALQQGNNELAIHYFDEALQLASGNAWYLNNKGYAYLQLHRLDSAEYLINTSMKLDPYNAWVYRNKGLLEKDKGNNSNMLKYLKKAYQLDKGVDNLMTDLAEAYFLNGLNTKACEMLEQLPDSVVLAKKKLYCSNSSH